MTDDPRPISDDDDIDALGAAPTVPAGGRGNGGNAGGGGAPRTKRGRRRRWLPAIVIIAIVLLALTPTVAASFKKTPRNMVGISYGGGPFESARFQRIVQPGSGLFFNGIFDPLYLYPSDTQNYIVSKNIGEGATKQPDSITAPSQDRVPIEYQVAVYFKLNLDRLKAFHESLGLQYNAFTTNGWNNLIRDTFRQQIENAIQEETRQYAVADLYGNADVLAKVQTDVEAKISDRLVSALGQPFFCAPTYTIGRDCGSPTFIVKKIDIPPDVVNAFQAQRTAQIGVLTAQYQIDQRANEAKAIEALNQGLSQAGMPYVLLKAIESGNVTFWVLPSDSSLTIPAGNGGAAPAAPSGSSGGG
jgi:hypothetical protein